MDNKYSSLNANNLTLEQCKEKIKKISIIGGSGSGKSTLSSILSKELDIPAIHLDAINYKPNWVAIDKSQRDDIILSKADGDKWIIDGNYNKTLPKRLENADLVIWLDYSTFAQLKGVSKRIFSNLNKEKPELPGCKERLNFKFIKYVCSYNHKNRPKVVELLKNIPNDKLLIFKKQKDLNQWLKHFTNNDNILDNIV